MLHWMFHCKDVSQKVSESMDRKLPLHHRMFIRIHLLMCKYCDRFRQQLHILREAARLDEETAETPDTALSLSLEAKIRLKESLSPLSE